MEKSKASHYLAFSVLLGSFAFGIMSFILPIYTKGLGGSASIIGGLFSIFSLVTAIMRPLVGRQVDRFGRKPFLIAAFISYAISMMLYSFSYNIWMIYVSRLIQAVASSFLWITAYAVMADLSAMENRGHSFGKIDAAASRGALYGAVIGFTVLSIIPFAVGWSILFKAFSVLAVLAGWIVYHYIPETNEKPNTLVTRTKTGLLLRNKPFRRLLCIVFINSCSTSMLSPILMIYLQDRFTKFVGALALAYLPAALIYALLPAKFGQISDKIGRIRPMILGFLGSAIVSLGIAFCNSLILLIVLWALEAVGIVMASPAEESFVSDLTSGEMRGAAYGLYLFVSSIGGVAGPLLGGWIYDSTGHMMPFIWNGILLIVNALLVLFLFHSHKKKRFPKSKEVSPAFSGSKKTVQNNERKCVILS